jgi:hypothetical protein
MELRPQDTPHAYLIVIETQPVDPTSFCCQPWKKGATRTL